MDIFYSIYGKNLHFSLIIIVKNIRIRISFQ